MSDEQKGVVDFTQEMEEMIADLLKKSDVVIEKTEKHNNLDVNINGKCFPVRVDDHQLMYIGARLLPNILNYLLNIIPQFMYPYVVAYLQDLSNMREDPLTINELYNYLIDLENHGNI